MKDKIKTGDIFKFQNEYVAEVIRVFCFNKKQVMYEFWYEDIESWSMINEKTCIFFRMPRGLFNKFSTIIDSSNWTDSDLKKIRPDLPLEIAVNSSCKWSLPIGKFNYELEKLYEGIDSNMPISKICLFTIGKNGGIKNKRHYFDSEDGVISIKDLMLFAYKIVNEVDNSKVNSTGLVRMGYNNNIPSFIIKGDD